MTDRERFVEYMLGQPVDRPPFWLFRPRATPPPNVRRPSWKRSKTTWINRLRCWKLIREIILQPWISLQMRNPTGRGF